MDKYRIAVFKKVATIPTGHVFPVKLQSNGSSIGKGAMEMPLISNRILYGGGDSPNLP